MNPRPLPSDFLALTHARRARIEATIEALIALLDEADGDTDLEDSADDEPSLGAPAVGPGDDRELDYAESGIADPDGLAWFSPMLAAGNPLVNEPAF